MMWKAIQKLLELSLPRKVVNENQCHTFLEGLQRLVPSSQTGRCSAVTSNHILIQLTSLACAADRWILEDDSGLPSGLVLRLVTPVAAVVPDVLYDLSKLTCIPQYLDAAIDCQMLCKIMPVNKDHSETVYFQLDKARHISTALTSEGSPALRSSLSSQGSGSSLPQDITLICYKQTLCWLDLVRKE